MVCFLFSKDELFRNVFEAGKLVDYLYSCGPLCWDQLEVADEDYYLLMEEIRRRDLEFEYAEFCYEMR